MKRLMIFLTIAFALNAQEPPLPEENPDIPFRERTEPEEAPSNTKKATLAVIGTLAAITIGLIASGANTGKHAPSNNDS
ncbi:hypothetical protein [Candidatus Neptunochlamydia vexilliferae]|uniref:Secreted protein n=1 Tax=Candidatus Neptunichlamydia vexilliferae TaxID=1651774 RepID=A0ABS0B110_9BACT|nr:hypothetical protein [Candidatus Neptunochlamydia vexilliferae]MBF5059527.1 hypothetical protein [Candidatus Neptunochlamydia vexilliferae]